MTALPRPLLLSLAVAIGAAPAWAQTDADTRAELDALKAELALEKAARLEAEEKLATRVDKVENAENGKAAGNERDVAASSAGVELSGLVQVDLAARQSSESQLDPAGEPLNEDRFTLRRARLRLVGELGMVVSALELDFNTVRGAQARIVNAEATLRVPPDAGTPTPLAFTAGLFKIPFGLEVLQSDRDRLFLERSTVIRALFPGEYDLGLRIAGSFSFLRYAAAMHNGNPLGDRQFPGRDPNDAKDISGRVGVDVSTEGLRVTAGVSATTGKGVHRGTPATKDVVVWRDLNSDGVVQANELDVIRGTSATPSIDFDRFGVGADASITFSIPGLGPLTVYGEAVVAQNLDRGIQPADPIPALRDFREVGWYVAAVQRIGPIAIGARYDRYDPDTDLTGLVAGATVPADSSYSSLALTAAYVAERARLIVEGDINRNHLGRDPAGVPDTLPDSALTIRAEVRF